MDWFFTWQDPVAIGLALVGFMLAFRPMKRQEAGCDTCAAKQLIERTVPRS